MSIFNLFRNSHALVRKEIFQLTGVRLCSTQTPPEIQPEAEDDGGYKRGRLKKPEHPVQLCLDYMKSKAYKETYGDKPVWHSYVRNFKGSFPPDTRENCLKHDRTYRTNNPCPICRDQYLLPHYQNIELLKQFISPYGGEILSTR